MDLFHLLGFVSQLITLFWWMSVDINVDVDVVVVYP